MNFTTEDYRQFHKDTQVKYMMDPFLAERDKEKADKTMFVCSQMINSLAILFAPVLPYTSANIQSLYSNEITIGDDALMVDIWSSAAMPMLKPGVQFRTPEILFGRIEDEFVDAEKDKLGEKNNKEEEKAPAITFDDFMKIELKTAKVIAAEPIKKSNKLLKLKVEVGRETRQIIAGISQHYTAEEIIGKTVVVVANLAPAKLMGELSEGMLLAVNSDDGSLALVSPEKPVSSGQVVR